MTTPQHQTSVTQNIFGSLQMQKMLHVLQMNALELQEWVLQEIEKNPLLEIPSFKSERKEEAKILQAPYFPSFQEHMLSKAKSFFKTPASYKIAQTIIGSLTKEGFFVEEINEFAKHFNFRPKEVETILSILKTFDPVGSFAKDVQECLLLQLEEKKKQSSLAYQIIRDYFSFLFQANFSFLEKKLRLSQKKLFSIIKKEIRPLSFAPASSFNPSFSSHLIVDLKLEKGGKVTYQENIPSISWKQEYLQIKTEKEEEKKQLYTFHKEGLFFLKALHKRKETLEKIGSYIVSFQKEFLEENEKLKPLTIENIAENLHLHPSTVSRAIREKTIETEKGVLFLKNLLSCSLPQNKEVSEKEAKEILSQLIQKEDKKSPLSDRELSEKMEEKGILLSRRTIAKYRLLLQIPSQNKRKAIFDRLHN